MSKFRELRVQRQQELAVQYQLFNIVFSGQVVTPEMTPAHIKQLHSVMWAAWRTCCYTNGIIAEGLRNDEKVYRNEVGSNGTDDAPSV